MKIFVFLKSNYYLFEPYVDQQVNVTITLDFATSPRENYEIAIRIYFSLSQIVETPINSTYTFGFWGYPPVGTPILNIPGGLGNGSVNFLSHKFSSADVLSSIASNMLFCEKPSHAF